MAVHAIRTTHHVSAIAAAVALVARGVIVGFTRHDRLPDDALQLRADQQTLEPPAPATPPDSEPATHTPTQGSAEGVPRPLGKLRAPIHAPTGRAGASGGAAATKNGRTPTNATGSGSNATKTTQRSGGETPGTTAPRGGSDSGRAAAFAPNRIAYSAAGAVWTVNANGTDARQVAAPGYAPAWSPDHTAIAYVDGTSNGGGALRVVTATGDYGLTTGVASDGQPAWSPDGGRIAFARVDYSNDEYSEIWSVNATGGGLTQLTHLACLNRDPAWSPDGTKIAFWSSSDHCGNGNYTLYTYDVATQTVAPLGTHANSSGPAWSPDNTQIAFAGDGYDGVGFEICVMRLDGSNQHRITTLSGDDVDPAWSPDGTKIAFSRDGGVYTMNADGSGETLLVTGASQPAWA